MGQAEFAFDVDLVTPLFSSGFDRDQPELRVPSIRGAMRFWFRAMMGGVVGGVPQEMVERVRRLEALVFGGTGYASPVMVRLARTNHPLCMVAPRDAQDFRKRFPRYLGYLAYGMGGARRGDVPRPYLSCDDRYDARASFRYALTLETPEDRATVVLGTLWLMTRLGGIGGRVHRGFGGLKVLANGTGKGQIGSLPHVLEFFAPPATAPDAPKHLGDGLSEIRQVFQAFAARHGCPGSPITAPPGFSTITQDPRYFSLYAVPLKGYSTSWGQALSRLGESLRTSRENQAAGQHSARGFSYSISRDYAPIKQSLVPNPSQAKLTLRNPIFGLPVQFQFQSTGKQGTIRGYNRSTGPDPVIERRASPLWLRLCPSRDHTFTGLVFIFKSEFLPEKAELQVVEQVESARGQRQIVPRAFAAQPPSWQAVDDFLSHPNLNDKQPIQIR